MNPKFRVKDLMERTAKNLDFIWKRHDEFELFEVTQLVNSFLGAFIHVKEAFYESIPKDPLPKPGWPQIVTDSGYGEPKHLRELVRWVRNSIAHGNLDFVPAETSNEISAVRIWNNDRNGSKTWGALIKTSDLKFFLDAYISLMTPILEQHQV